MLSPALLQEMAKNRPVGADGQRVFKVGGRRAAASLLRFATAHGAREMSTSPCDCVCASLSIPALHSRAP